MLTPAPVTTSLLGASSEEIIGLAVTSREPDSDVHQDDVAWWLAVQERMEIRAELAASDLL